jgi:hypothetical protein
VCPKVESLVPFSTFYTSILPLPLTLPQQPSPMIPWSWLQTPTRPLPLINCKQDFLQFSTGPKRGAWRQIALSRPTLPSFATRRETCSPGHTNNVLLPQAEEGKYLGLHLDRRLTWRNHIFANQITPGTWPYPNYRRVLMSALIQPLIYILQPIYWMYLYRL